MLGLTSIAMENLIASYNARFRPNPESQGYLFNKDDYGEGVVCSTEQYETYAIEFEQFVARKNRFMWLWLFLVLTLFAVSYGFVLFNYGSEILDSKDDLISVVMGVLIVLPLAFIVKQGWSIYQKPVYELVGQDDPVQKRQSVGEIVSRRLKGMSSTIIVIGLSVSAIGLYFSLCEILGFGCIEGVDQYDSPYLKYFFGTLFIGFALTAWGKFRAHQKDTRILQQQNNEYTAELLPKPSPAKAQQAYLKLVDLSLHGNNPAQLRQEIVNVSLNEPENWKADGYGYEYDYFYAIVEALEETDMMLLYMDWKEAVSDYYWKINRVLGKRSIELVLPDITKYPDNASIEYEGVFSDTTAALHHAGIEICFIDTGSDSYHALLFDQTQREKIAAIIPDIQLPYSFATP